MQIINLLCTWYPSIYYGYIEFHCHFPSSQHPELTAQHLLNCSPMTHTLAPFNSKNHIPLLPVDSVFKVPSSHFILPTSSVSCDTCRIKPKLSLTTEMFTIQLESDIHYPLQHFPCQSKRCSKQPPEVQGLLTVFILWSPPLSPILSLHL